MTSTPDAEPAPVYLDGPRFQRDPAQLYRELRREHGAVAPALLPGGIPAWLVLGYREVHQVTSDSTLFPRDATLWNQWENIPEDWPLKPLVSRTQDSIRYEVGERRHERTEMIEQALEEVDTFRLQAHTEQLADELLDAVCGKGEMDLVADFARVLPVLILARLFGFPDEQGPSLADAFDNMINGQEGAITSQTYLIQSTARLVADRRAQPTDDVVSRMLAHPGGFTDQQITRDVMVVMGLGHQASSAWISGSLRLMLTDDRFAASLFGGQNSATEAMKEVLWEETPLQNMPGRWAARDTLLGGRSIHRGDFLLLSLQSANSDPQIRLDGSTFTGGNSAHLSFGHGDHRCPFPAQVIAEVFARTAIEVVLDRLPDIDLAVPAASLTRRPSPWNHALSALPVRFTPVPAS